MAVPLALTCGNPVGWHGWMCDDGRDDQRLGVETSIARQIRLRMEITSATGLRPISALDAAGQPAHSSTMTHEQSHLVSAGCTPGQTMAVGRRPYGSQSCPDCHDGPRFKRKATPESPSRGLLAPDTNNLVQMSTECRELNTEQSDFWEERTERRSSLY